MNLVGIMPVRNEDWDLGLTLRALLKWCDKVVITDHRSSDNTPMIVQDVCRELSGASTGSRVLSILDPDREWHEMEQREFLLKVARAQGATHISILDADEILTGNLLPSIRGMVEQLPPGWILQLPGYNLRGSLHSYHSNGLWGTRVFSAAFADHPELNWAGDMFHHREPMGFGPKTVQIVEQGAGGIMHLWGASEKRLAAKHALYKVVERIRFPLKSTEEIEQLYSLWAGPPAGDQWSYAETPREWWAPYSDLMQYVSLDDSNPWQIQEVRRLVELHGREKFTGLNLFGVL